MTDAVVARGVELTYGDRVALAASDFRFPAGAITALIGPNGSGKSTVLAAVAGLHEPAAGELTVLGSTPRKERPRIAFVPQSTKVNDLLPVTVREVVAMGRYASLGMLGRFGPDDRAALDEALDRLDLQPLAARHLREVSGGQRQRVFVAQGLVQSHDMLLLDEPTTGLDIVSTEVIRQVVQSERADGCAVVITTHDFAEARAADHVVLLANRVVAEGAPEEVFTPENLADAYGLELNSSHEHVDVDDPAHRPTQTLHRHVEIPPLDD